MKIRTVLSKLFLSNVSNVFLTKVTKHLCLLNLNIMFCNKTVYPNWPYSLLGNFADKIKSPTCIDRTVKMGIPQEKEERQYTYIAI